MHAKTSDEAHSQKFMFVKKVFSLKKVNEATFFHSSFIDQYLYLSILSCVKIDKILGFLWNFVKIEVRENFEKYQFAKVYAREKIL